MAKWTKIGRSELRRETLLRVWVKDFCWTEIEVKRFVIVVNDDEDGCDDDGLGVVGVN